MRYMAEDNLALIQAFGERMAGPSLTRGIARLYSQHTRLRAGTSGLLSWTNDELLARLGEGEKLLVAGMAAVDSLDYRRYLRRAGEIFEWAATSSPAVMPIPVVLLAASAYQLAGYPARASGYYQSTLSRMRPHRSSPLFFAQIFPKPSAFWSKLGE